MRDIEQSLWYQYSRFLELDQSFFGEFVYIYEDAVRWSWIMLVVSCGQISVAGALLAWQYRREQNHYHYFYQYLLIIPTVHLTDNVAIKTYIESLRVDEQSE